MDRYNSNRRNRAYQGFKYKIIFVGDLVILGNAGLILNVRKSIVKFGKIKQENRDLIYFP